MSVAIDERRALQVGGVALGLLAAAVVFVLAIWDRIEIGERVRFAVRFGHVGALRAGAPVLVAGIEIGEIESIDLGAASADPAVRRVTARVAIDAAYRGRVPVDAAFFVSSRGLLSERLLEIGPGPGPTPGRPIAPGDLVEGIDPPSLDQTLQKTWERLEIARVFLDQVRPEDRAFGAALTELGGSVDAAVAAIDGDAAARLGPALGALWAAAVEAWHKVDVALGGDGGRTLDDAERAIDVTVAAARGAIGTLTPRWQALRAGVDDVLARVDHAAPALAARIRVALATVDATVERIAPLRRAIDQLMVLAQKGTIMKVLSDPEFPEDARELGKILKREPWRIVGHPDDQAAP